MYITGEGSILLIAYSVIPLNQKNQTKQSICPLICPYTNHSINTRSVNQSINQSINQSVSQLVSQFYQSYSKQNNPDLVSLAVDNNTLQLYPSDSEKKNCYPPIMIKCIVPIKVSTTGESTGNILEKISTKTPSQY